MASLNRLDMGKINRDGVDGHHKIPASCLSNSAAPLPSPTASYAGPPPPYSCSSSASTSNLGAFDYISPPSSRRTTLDHKAPDQRQSLPSIQEALGGDRTMPFSAANIAPPLSATPRISQQTASFVPGQSLPEAPLGPPNPFSQGPTVGQITENEPYLPRSANHQDPPSEQTRPNHSFPSINTAESITAPSHAFDSKSPKPRSAHPVPPNVHNGSPHANGYNLSSDTSPSRFPPYRSPYVYPTGPSNPTSSALPTTPDYSRFNPAFKFDDCKPSIPRSHPVQPYSDSVKRHLDIFDVEMALSEVCMDNHRSTGAG